MARQLRKLGRIALVLMAWFGASVLTTTSAEAGSSGFTIDEWKVPAGCGDQPHFTSLVREAIGEWPENLPEVHAAVAIEKTQQHWTLVLSTKAPSGEGRRQISGSSCEELLQTAAVILSLALDSEALYDNELAHTVQTSEQRASPPETVTVGQMGDDETPGMWSRENSKDVSKHDQPSEALDTSLHLVALSDLGTLPRPAFGLGVLASAQPGLYRVSFRLTKWADQVQYVGEAEDRGGNFDLLSGSLQVCRELPHNRKIPWGLCVQGTLARMSASGIVEMGGTSAEAVKVLGSYGLGVFLRLPLGLHIYAESNAQVVRPRYRITADPENTEAMDTDVYQPSLVTARLGLSWGMSF